MSWKPSMAQGQGAGTLRKEQGLEAIFAASLDISKGGRAIEWPYWHIDLNAGCGWNEKADCEGSPLVFTRRAIQEKRRFNAIFCDCESPAIDSLAGRLDRFTSPNGSTIALRCEDNSDCLAWASMLIASRENPQYAVGTCLCDPNGYRFGFPVDALSAFAERFPRIDIILNLNASLFARVRGCKEDGQEAFTDWPDLADFPAMFHREHWMIRNPTPGGRGDRFIILLGRTFNSGQRKFADFFPLRSFAGEVILRDLKRIDPRQLYLPGME